MHIITLNEAESTSSFRIEGSWREKVMAATQDFIRTVSSPLRDCNSQSANVPTTPVIFHVDDYLGNMQREILATTELSQAVQVLANYYGNVVAMSYPDLVRDFVYGDTHEAWFSPLGWYPTYKQGTNQMAREIHPGMPMHTTIPWIVSYNMLNLLLTYCDKYPYHHENVRSSSGNPEEDNPRAKIFDDEYDVARTKGNLPLPELKKVVPLPGKPRITPNGLPPPLSPDLSLQDFTDLWKSQADSTNINNRAHTVQCTSPEHPKCPFSWVSGLLSEHNSLDEQGVVDYFKANSLGYFNHGWELKRNVDGRKMGWLPVGEQPGANMTMIFGNADSSPIRQVVLLYLKSYGERWDNSILQVRIDRLSTFEPIMYRQLVGYHAKNTSEMYVERMPLPEPRAGEDPRVRLQAFFMNGRAFKIMGLLICR